MINKALTVIVGRAGRDAEEIKTRTGKLMAKTSIAAQEQDGNELKGAHWIDVVGFDEVAQYMLQHVSKGGLVRATGRVADNVYTSRRGEEVRKQQMTLSGIEVVNRPSQSNPYHKPAAQAAPGEDDDIPF